MTDKEIEELIGRGIGHALGADGTAWAIFLPILQEQGLLPEGTASDFVDRLDNEVARRDSADLEERPPYFPGCSSC